MKKEELLEKIRAEKEDEGVQYAQNQGLKIGYKIFTLLNIFLIIFNLFMAQNSFDLMSLFWGFIAADAYSKYKFMEDKALKITIIAASIACVVFLINHILYSIR